MVNIYPVCYKIITQWDENVNQVGCFWVPERNCLAMRDEILSGQRHEGGVSPDLRHPHCGLEVHSRRRNTGHKMFPSGIEQLLGRR